MRLRQLIGLFDLMLLAFIVFIIVNLVQLSTKLNNYTWCTYPNSIAAGASNEPCIGGDAMPLPATVVHYQYRQTTYLFLLVLTIGLFVSVLAAEGFYYAKAGQSNGLIYLYLLLLVVVPWLTILAASVIEASSYISEKERNIASYIAVPMLLIMDYIILNYGIRLATRSRSYIWLAVFIVSLIAVSLLTAGAITYLVLAI